MHDGSIQTLEDVLKHYEAGGSAAHPNRSPLLKAFTLTRQEREDIVSFLRSLTDREFVSDPRFRDPWERQAESGQ